MHASVASEALATAARHAWRRAARCVGRAGWSSLDVRDSRALTDPEDVARDLVEHLDVATAGGAVRPTLTVLHPDVRVLNEQLVRYADDARYAGFVDSLERTGWRPSGVPQEVLPLAVLVLPDTVTLHPLPERAVLEVDIEHPQLPWIADLGLRWHAVPAVSNMLLRLPPATADGLATLYPVVFNGWYVSDEISARNLADRDRYDVLPVVVEGLLRSGPATGLSSGACRSGPLRPDAPDEDYWRQRALIELDRAVLHSYRRAGVKISSPAREAHRFVRHVERERCAGRPVPADWSWTISPIAPVLLPTYHRYYDGPDLGPGPDLVHDNRLARAGRRGWHEDVTAPHRGGVAGAAG